jgi:hypothetical protein
VNPNILIHFNRLTGDVMLVRDLKVGHLYKVREDRPTRIYAQDGWLDVHVLTSKSRADHYKFRKNSVVLYLGIDKIFGDSSSNRVVLYKGKKYYVYFNVWQHIVQI